jgi:WD40 repeat protein/tRNA A-37 threonylcarbamoyl transferase component Bud32
LCPGCLLEQGLTDAATLSPPAPVQMETETLALGSLPVASAGSVTSSEAASPAPVSASVPGYEILAELGRGGMGVVYKARQTKLQRLVALKMILAGGHASAADLARFRTEAESIARLQHPNIVQVFEVGEHQGKAFFSLEYCDGGSLAEKLKGTPLPPKEAATLVETLARAMASAHEKGIVHRDLKPANVLLGKESAPKISDFGLAKKLDEASQTATGAVMGTPSYMAPEQAGGKGKEVTAAADIYALGAILYECLTGRPPFKAATPLDTVLQVVNDDPVPPTKLQSKTPRNLETICLKCLQKEPGKRYATALALAEDLRRFQAGEPILARAVGRAERTVKWVRRHPALAALLAMVVIGTAAGFGLIVWRLEVEGRLRVQAEGERVAADEARGTAENRRQEAERNLLEARTNLYYSRLAQAEREWRDDETARARRLLTLCPEEQRAWEWHYLNRLFDDSAWTLDVPGILRAGIVFSPDGMSFVGPVGNQAKVFDLRTGKEILALAKHPNRVLQVAFSADGKRLVSRSGGEVKVFDLPAGRQVFSTTMRGSEADQLAFSPDGGQIAYAGRDPDVYLWGVGGRREILLPKKQLDPGRRQPVRVVALAYSPDGKRLAVATDHGPLKVIEVATRREVLSLAGMTSPVTFSPNGNLFACHVRGAWDIVRATYPPGEVKVWQVQTGKEAWSVKADTWAFAFSPDGQHLAGAVADRSVRLWRAATGEETLVLRGHSARAFQVAFSPDGQRLASAAGDDTRSEFKVWDLPDCQRRALPAARHVDPITAVAFSPDSSRLAYTTAHHPPGVLDLATGTSRPLDKGSERVSFSPDGRRIATLLGITILVYDLETGKEAFSFKGHTYWVHLVAFSPGGKYLASDAGPVDKAKNSYLSAEVKLWDAQTGREVRTLKGRTVGFGRGMGLRAVAFSPGDKYLAALAHNWVAKVWEVETGEEVLSLNGVSAFGGFDADGTRLCGATQRKLKVWEVSTGKEILTLEGHGGLVNSVAFSPDGRRLASGSDDKSVKIWDARTGQELLTLRGHSGEVMCLAFSADGRRLASGSRDRTVRLWDATTRPPRPKGQ